MNTLYSENMKGFINIDPIKFPMELPKMGFEFIEEIMATEKHPLKHPLAMFRKVKVDRDSQ